MPATFYPEGTTPLPTDDERRSLIKLNAAIQAGIPVTGVELNGNVSVGALEIDQTAGKNGVVVNSSALPTGAATQATLAAVLAKIIAAPATEAKQDTGNTTLASILAKLISNPATEATLAETDGKVTTLRDLLLEVAAGTATLSTAVVSSPLPTGASTEATLSTLNGKVTACNTGAVVISSGSVTNTPVAATLANSAAYEASRIVKASAGTLYSIAGYNSGPAQFLHIYNSTTLPAEGAAPIMVFAIPATASFSFSFPLGLPCSAGIVVGNSTTAPIKTIGSANCYFTATFR